MVKIRPLRVWFHNFWGNFNSESNYFTDLLECNGHKISISDNKPDIVFESFFGHGQSFVGDVNAKFFFCGENKQLNPFYNGYTLSFGPTTNNNYQLPLWALYINWYRRPDVGNPKRIPIENLTTTRQTPDNAFGRSFCNFIYNNPNGNERNSIWTLLNGYKHVSCLGRWGNDAQKVLGGDENDKIAAMRNYKFSIAGENSLGPGYVTEKILHAFAANTIPIYWGSAKVTEYFNPNAFINANNYQDLYGNFDIDALINDVKLIDKSETLYNKMLSEPIFKDNKVPEELLPSRIYKWIIEKV